MSDLFLWWPSISLHALLTALALWFAASCLVFAGWIAGINHMKSHSLEARYRRFQEAMRNGTNAKPLP